MADNTLKAVLTAADTQQPVQIDPADPKTWWMAQFSKRGKWLTISAQGPDHVMRLSGMEPARFHTEPKPHMAAEAAVSAYYGLEGLMLGEDVYNFEAEALGQKMIYGHSMPTIDFREPLVSEKKDLDRLVAPTNWLDCGRVRYMAEIQKDLHDMGMQAGFFCAPFSLAVGVRSYPKLIRDMKRDPVFARELFERLVDQILPSYVKTMADYSGFKMLTGADAWAAYPDLSPQLMEEWVLPYSQKLIMKCGSMGLVALPIAVGDYCEEDLTKFDKSTLFRCFDIQVKNMGGVPSLLLGMGRWQDYPLEAVAEYLQPFRDQGVRAPVNVSVNARFLRESSPDKIVAFVKHAVDVLARDHEVSFFLASTPSDTPPLHVHAAVAAAHTYGKLPIAENLDAVEFQMPERETFEEYVSKMSNGLGLQA